MKSCLNCKYTEETIFENVKKCINPDSGYHFDGFVEEKDICSMFTPKEGKHA